MPSPRFCLPGWTLFLILSAVAPTQAYDGVEVVSYYGYDDCIRLQNETTTVVLCPAAGGRVLEYSLHGKNMLYLPKGDEGWRHAPGSNRATMNAGRFDIGPEKIVRRGKILWQGAWKGEIIGDRRVRLTSEFDSESGARLVRDFQLHQSATRLRCTQTIRNESDHPVSLCHWSRTFAIGGGVAVVPRTPRGRFPNGYVMYPTGTDIQFRPEDPNIQVTEKAVIVTAAPEFPKLGFDSHAGWLAYLAPNDQMFVKRYKTYPDRAYNELAGLTLSVWYPGEDRVELEPIGPAEDLRPGEQASFSEEWWLLEHDFPSDVTDVDFASIQTKVRRNTVPALANPEPPVSPEVHANGRVTFRFTAATAKDVKVKLGSQTLALERYDGDLWQVTTKPLPAGIHDYGFEIDGVRVTDPRNRWVKKWKVCASMVEVPGSPALVTEQQTVPHGTLHHHIYDSDATGTERAAIVYTPPGYSPASPTPYPLLVLCHGNGDDQTAWTEVGRAHLILDNLIAEKKIEPMIVVMPHGHPVPLAERTWSEDSRDRNRLKMAEDIVTGVLPMVEAHYLVSDEASRRAITGLSMGGGQSIATGMAYPDLFQWVGAFSAAAPDGNLDSQQPQLKLDADSNASRQLFWIACGRKDFLVQRNRDFVKRLTDRGIDHEYVETDGSHSWEVWRDYLPQFLQLVFK